MAGCTFGLLFSPEVLYIRNTNSRCSCLKVSQLCSNTPILDFGISNLLEVACLSFEDVLHVSECSHRGLSIGMQRGRQMLDFLRIRSANRETRWQRVKSRIEARWQRWAEGGEYIGDTAEYLADDGIGQELARIGGMTNREIFWAPICWYQ